MNPTTSLAAIAMAAALVHAQTTQNYYVAPTGTESIEGNGLSNISLSYASSRVQQVDNSMVGGKLAFFRAIAWRRNANLVAGSTHLAEIEIRMGHSDFSTVSTTFANNYKGAPTVVFPKQKVTLDWTRPAKLTPAEYDLVFPFTAPFIYNRTDAVLWETVTTTGGTNRSDYAQDWFTGTSPATIFGPRPSELGTGCTTPNGAMTLGSSFRSSSATNFDYAFSIRGGPSSQPTVLLLAMSAINAPLFCGTLWVNPLLTVPIGSTDPNGNIPLTYASTTWSPSVADSEVFTQALALDGSQASGVAMSNGLDSRSPRAPGGARAHDIKRSFHTSNANSPTGSTPSLSSVATKYIQ